MRPYKIGDFVTLTKDFDEPEWKRGKRGIILRAFLDSFDGLWTYEVRWEGVRETLMHTRRTIKKRCGPTK